MILERQCWANAQSSRKECVEVVGSPRQVDDRHLDKTHTNEQKQEKQHFYAH